MPHAPFYWSTLPHGVSTFLVPILQVPTDRVKWFDAYEWGIVSADGLGNQVVWERAIRATATPALPHPKAKTAHRKVSRW